MEVQSKLTNVRMSAQKARTVAKQVRGLPVAKAIDLLRFSPKKAAKHIHKTLVSAIANAENNNGLDIDELRISTICVDEAVTMKRFRARAKGRGTRINKRGCHITVKVAEKTSAREE